MFGSALLRREGVRGFGFGIGCSGLIQMARDGRRQVGIGRIGVGSVTVVTSYDQNTILDTTKLLKKIIYYPCCYNRFSSPVRDLDYSAP